MAQSSDIPSFRSQRGFFGYKRKPTDEFLGYMAELLEQAGKRLDEAESELAQYREKEQSLSEVLLAAAKTAEAIKDDARRDAETIRGEARQLDEFVRATRIRLSAFLHETRGTLEGIAKDMIAKDMHSRGQASDMPESSGAGGAHSIPPTGAGTKPDNAEPAEETGSILERLRPYRADTSGGSSGAASHSPAQGQNLSDQGSR